MVDRPFNIQGDAVNAPAIPPIPVTTPIEPVKPVTNDKPTPTDDEK